jgi:hypothetical protein
MVKARANFAAALPLLTPPTKGPRSARTVHCINSVLHTWCKDISNFIHAKRRPRMKIWKRASSERSTNDSPTKWKANIWEFSLCKVQYDWLKKNSQAKWIFWAAGWKMYGPSRIVIRNGAHSLIREVLLRSDQATIMCWSLFNKWSSNDYCPEEAVSSRNLPLQRYHYNHNLELRARLIVLIQQQFCWWSASFLFISIRDTNDQKFLWKLPVRHETGITSLAPTFRMIPVSHHWPRLLILRQRLQMSHCSAKLTPWIPKRLGPCSTKALPFRAPHGKRWNWYIEQIFDIDIDVVNT